MADEPNSMKVDGGYDGGPRNVEVVYPDNSRKAKEKKNEPVRPCVHGKQVVVHKTLWEKIKDLFLEPEDAPDHDYIYEDIIEPAIADGVANIAQGLMDSLMGGLTDFLFPNGTRRYYGSRRGTTWSRRYDEYYDDRRNRRSDLRDSRERQARNRRSDDPAAMVESKEEAMRLIYAMQDRVHDYDVASVLNFYDMADMPTNSIDDEYGWDKDHPFEARVTYTRDGWIVTPVRPVHIER